jgi:hypothetical protein
VFDENRILADVGKDETSGIFVLHAPNFEIQLLISETNWSMNKMM